MTQSSPVKEGARGTVPTRCIINSCPTVQSRDPSINLAQFTVSILFSDTHIYWLISLGPTPFFPVRPLTDQIHTTQNTTPFLCPLTNPYHAYHHAHLIYIHTKPNNQGNNNTYIQQNIKRLNCFHTQNKYRPSVPHAMKKKLDYDSPADSR